MNQKEDTHNITHSSKTSGSFTRTRDTSNNIEIENNISYNESVKNNAVLPLHDGDRRKVSISANNLSVTAVGVSVIKRDLQHTYSGEKSASSTTCNENLGVTTKNHNQNNNSKTNNSSIFRISKSPFRSKNNKIFQSESSSRIDDLSSKSSTSVTQCKQSHSHSTKTNTKTRINRNFTTTWTRILDKLDLSKEQQHICNTTVKIFVYNKKAKSNKHAKAKFIKIHQGCVQLISTSTGKVTFSIPMPQLQSIYNNHDHQFWHQRPLSEQAIVTSTSVSLPLVSSISNHKSLISSSLVVNSNNHTDYIRHVQSCIDDPKRCLSIEYSDPDHNNFQYIHLSFESSETCNEYKSILSKLNNARNSLTKRDKMDLLDANRVFVVSIIL